MVASDSSASEELGRVSAGIVRRLLFEFILLGIWGALVAVFAILCYIFGERLDAVTLRFTGPGAEPADAVVLGLGKEGAKPDYLLVIVTAKGRVRCPAPVNTSAVDGIRFAVPQDISLRLTEELVLLEADKGVDDWITSVRFVPPSMSAGGYVFSVASSRSLWAGFTWFNGTRAGGIYTACLILFTLALIVRIVIVLQVRPDDLLNA